MTPQDPFWRGLSGTNSGGPIRSRALLFTPEIDRKRAEYGFGEYGFEH